MRSATSLMRYHRHIEGHLRSQTDPAGRRTSYTYDLNGNRTSKSVVWTGPGGATMLTTTFADDEKNRLIATTDPMGQVERVEYDALSHVVGRIDKLGRRTRFVYSETGWPLTRIDPDGSEEGYGGPDQGPSDDGD